MTIEVNGKPLEIPPGTTVAALLEKLALADRPCAVEVDGNLVRHRDHGARVLDGAKRVEVVTLVGGG